jgi:hypothetical protein
MISGSAASFLAFFDDDPVMPLEFRDGPAADPAVIFPLREVVDSLKYTDFEPVTVGSVLLDELLNAALLLLSRSMCGSPEGFPSLP